MEKVINGQLVEIGDIRLFELALEGIALNQKAVNKISIELKYDENVGKCVEMYSKAYNKLPFPLYSIETNLKYSCLANILKEDLDKVLKNKYNLWVNKGLHIFIKDSLIDLKFIGITWSIDYIEEPYRDNTDLDNYKQDVGYNEYKWLVENHSSSDNLALDFYSKFMGNLLRACGSNAEIMVREFTRILNFENVPEFEYIKPNTIVGDKLEYYVDIYCDRLVKTGKHSLVIDLTVDDSDFSKEDEEEPVVCVKAYKRSYITNIEGKDILGSLVEDPFVSKLLNSTIEFDMDTEIKGIKANDVIVLEIDEEIYKLDIQNRTLKLLGNGVRLHGFNGNYVYFIRKQGVRDGVVKNIIYKYNTINGNIGVAKIYFS